MLLPASRSREAVANLFENVWNTSFLGCCFSGTGFLVGGVLSSTWSGQPRATLCDTCAIGNSYRAHHYLHIAFFGDGDASIAVIFLLVPVLLSLVSIMACPTPPLSHERSTISDQSCLCACSPYDRISLWSRNGDKHSELSLRLRGLFGAMVALPGVPSSGVVLRSHPAVCIVARNGANPAVCMEARKRRPPAVCMVARNGAHAQTHPRFSPPLPLLVSPHVISPDFVSACDQHTSRRLSARWQTDTKINLHPTQPTTHMLRFSRGSKHSSTSGMVRCENGHRGDHLKPKFGF
jgi:hypothetical protein